jgi:hypothetical protein
MDDDSDRAKAGTAINDERQSNEIGTMRDMAALARMNFEPGEKDESVSDARRTPATVAIRRGSIKCANRAAGQSSGVSYRIGAAANPMRRFRSAAPFPP